MWLRTSCKLRFDIKTPTPFILMLRPRSGDQQWVASEAYILSPPVSAFEFTDDFGNLCQRLVAPPGDFMVSTTAIIKTSDTVDIGHGGEFINVENLPNSVLKYLLPSRYCESDFFNEMATEIVLNHSPGYDQVAAIERWLRENIRFEPGSSSFPSSAIEVNKVRVGVCRDLSHLGIALCRSLCIPTRMVVGYFHTLNPMELHAWFEAYVSGRWYTFDATQDTKKGGYVAIGYGRDAADVAIYNQFGPSVFPYEETVSVTLSNIT
ncbi:transglutaminase family protein [Sessilibacter sp. MAH1]